MARPARVLFAIPELNAGGPDRVVHELVCGLDRTEFLPLLAVAKPGGRYFAALPRDVEVHVTGGGRYPVWRFAKAVDALRPDLVFTTLRMNVTASLAGFFQRWRPPHVARQANAMAADFAQLKKTSLLKHRVAEQVVRRLIRMPDVLVAQSSDMAAELAPFATPRQRIVAIGNPVSLADIDAARAAQAAVGRRRVRGNPSLVAVGRLAPQKGFDLLLPAFARLLATHPDAVLTIFGEGPELPALEALVRELGIGGSVQLAGQSDRILAEVAAADLFVSSSRYEGFSNAILEAMALGRPVVVTDCVGATKDMVEDEKTGILVPPGSAAALEAGLRRALEIDRRAIGEAARRHVGTAFSRDGIAAAYAALFRSVLVHPERPARGGWRNRLP
jgi:glycosyltransferase involved in cell wall biosynthesis